MTLGAMLFSRPDWALPALTVMVLTALLLFWSYKTAPAGWPRWACPALKAVAISALLFCLLEPLWSGQRARPGANTFAILADNSEGMKIRDRGASRTRADKQAELLNRNKSSWQDALEAVFDVRRYYFDARLQTTRDFSDLAYDGHSSEVGGALRGVRERYQGRNLAGVLLFTDGNATDLRVAADIAADVPIYPVVMGSSEPVRDIAVKQTRSSHTDFEDAPVTIEAEVTASGCAGESVVGSLVNTQGKMVAEQSLKVRNDKDTLVYRFQLKPEHPGLVFYKFQARAQGARSSSEADEPTGEATDANNEAFIAVNRSPGPYRILYVSGRPNWEFKFLNRALQEDSQLQLTGLIRVARREPKFNFIGRAGETSNPLFRGFDNQAPEDVERYDHPVLVRLNTQDAQELRAGFPAAPEQLYSFHAIIVDDLEAGFFTADQLLLLQRFVSERGGGFLMLGGADSFQNGKYYHTPVGDMLPVYLDKLELASTNATFAFNLSREGWLQPWARLRDTEAAETARIESMTEFRVMNLVREVKPGASVVATARDNEGNVRPALVVQRFGHGRTAALTVGDLWRWGFKDAEAQKDMSQAWRQMMRWLVTDVPGRVDVAMEPNAVEGAGAVQLRVSVRDATFKPVDDAAVTLEVRPMMTSGASAQTNVVRLRAEPSRNEPGSYLASYSSRLPGAFQVTAWATNSAETNVGIASAGWSTDLASQEFHSLTPNVALLEDIARRTGGAMVRQSDLTRFARSLPNKRAPVMEGWTYPVWHTPALFIFALGCLVAEWGVRRWKGLP